MKPILRRIGPLAFRFDPTTGHCTGILDLSIARHTPQVLIDFASNVSSTVSTDLPTEAPDLDALMEHPEEPQYSPPVPPSLPLRPQIARQVSNPPATPAKLVRMPRVDFNKVRDRLLEKGPAE